MREQHTEASVYHNMGGGGVDFPAVMKLLRDRHYKGWVVLDMDGPRKGDDGFDAIGGNIDLAIDDYLAHNVNYMRVILGVKLPPLDWGSDNLLTSSVVKNKKVRDLKKGVTPNV